MSEAMFNGNCFTESEELHVYTKAALRFMNKCTNVSNNHNIQFFKIKFQNSFRPIAFFFFFLFFFFQIIVLLTILHLFFLYKL